MKAPDVIYVEFSEDVNLAFEEQPFEETPAYIRKEALLEWAKERYKSTISNVGCYTGHSVWQEVIEHINEM